MKVIISGGHGFLGSKLAKALLERKVIGPNGGDAVKIDEIVLVDTCPSHSPQSPDGIITSVTGDIAEEKFLREILKRNFDVIFHLASLVSGGAELDFERGLSSNLLATQRMLDICRMRGNCPTLVFTSSIAVYGGDLPTVIDDGTAVTPQTSYGAHKAACELLIHDYSRKGYLDGRSIRLPIVIIRPGKANTAASSFASSIFREPLSGEPSNCVLRPDDPVYVASAGNAIDAMLLAAESPRQAWGSFSAVMMPGRTTSPGEMVEALREFAGNDVAKYVHWSDDPFVRDIVRAWPSQFESSRAKSIGFSAEKSITVIIEEFVQSTATEHRQTRQ